MTGGADFCSRACRRSVDVNVMYTYLPPLRRNEPPGYSFESPVTAFGATEIDGRRVLSSRLYGGGFAGGEGGSSSLGAAHRAPELRWSNSDVVETWEAERVRFIGCECAEAPRRRYCAAKLLPSAACFCE